VYEGDWVHGVREGQGKLSFKDGSFYRGDFVKNQMWGHGIFVGESLRASIQLDVKWVTQCLDMPGVCKVYSV
jgi:hypothetical protein